MNFKIITPLQQEYELWNNRGVNLRFSGRPSEIIPVTTTEELTSALQYAVDKNYRVAIRGGGHCLENFVSNPDVNVIIDISAMKGIRYDPAVNAIEIKAGTTLGEVYETLYDQWGTVLPCGEHPAVGIGGHIQGGAFGFLCRQHGLGADYLYAVEVLCVNKNRQVEKVIATIDPSDRNRELWWAHTGGGAGNFGVVTRYWFRTPGSVSKDPSTLLPKVPTAVETIELEWQWPDINKDNFRRLVDNYGNWCFNNAQPGTKSWHLYATLHLWNKVIGKIQLKGLLTEPTEGIVDDFIRTVNNEVGVSCTIKRNKTSWVDFALNPFPDIFSGPKAAFKVKDAFLCQPFTHQQIDTIYHYLTEYKDVFGANIGLATYGGKVNSVASDATASVQRGAILGTACAVGWIDAKDAAKSMEWVRKCYSDLYRDTGGVPVPNKQTGGCIIAHPDNDIADPNWNKSGLPWHTFYYQGNYPRLQKIKATWDPLNIFRHSLSVEPDHSMV
jgi:hypothetical protein